MHFEKNRKEEKREIKRDTGSERWREGEEGRRVLKEEHLGGCGVRDCFGQALSTGDTLSHLLLPQLKSASAQFGPVLALVTPPAFTILHRTPTRPVTGWTDGINPHNPANTPLSHTQTHWQGYCSLYRITGSILKTRGDQGQFLHHAKIPLSQDRLTRDNIEQVLLGITVNCYCVISHIS